MCAKQKTIEEATEPAEQEVITTDISTVEDPESGAMVYNGSDEDFLAQQDSEDDNELSSFPRLVIDQKGKKATLGNLFCEETGDEFETMTMVLLKEAKSKIMWPEKYNSDNDPVCRSFDGIVPNMEDFEGVEPMAANCKDCKYGSWSKVNGKNIPPLCKDVSDLLLMDINSYIPYWMSFYATTLGPIKKGLIGKPLKLKKMSLTAKRGKAGLPPAHSCMFSFTMATKLEEFSGGDSYIPVVSDLKVLPEDELGVMVNIAKQCYGAQAHFAKTFEDDTGEGGSSAPADEEKF